MARRLFMFLSLMKQSTPHESYTAPDGKRYQGSGLSNEAPVRYLLEHYSKVDQIICVVTPDAKNSGALSHLQSFAPVDISILEVPFNDGAGPFEGAPLRSILEQFQAGDTLLIEATGGLRTFIMYFVQISHFLTYMNVTTEDMVYANLGPGTIESAMHILTLFDRADALNELVSFGSAAHLLRLPVSPALQPVMDTMDRLTAGISLCHIDDIETQINDLQKSISEAEARTDLDPLSRSMLQVFRAKFGGSFDLLGLMRWCIDSNLLQQAFAIFTEKLPRVLFTGVPGARNSMLTASATPASTTGISDEYKDLLMDLLSFESGSAYIANWLQEEVCGKNHIAYTKCFWIGRWLDPRAKLHGTPVNDLLSQLGDRDRAPELLDTLRNLLEYLRLAYPCGNYDPSWIQTANFDDAPLMRRLLAVDALWNNKIPPDLNTFVLRLEKGINKNMVALLEDTGALDSVLSPLYEPRMSPDERKEHIRQHLRSKNLNMPLPEGSDNEVKADALKVNILAKLNVHRLHSKHIALKEPFTLEDLRTICCNYTDIRVLRNHASHASGRNTAFTVTDLQKYKDIVISTIDLVASKSGL